MTNEELKKRIEEIIHKELTPGQAAIVISDLIQENFIPKGSKCTCSDRPGETKLWCCNNCGQRNEEF